MSNKTESTYHHGNLREELMHTAISTIREKGVEKLSLRALARDVGVSQTAPYRHFADKNALLAELATIALQELATVFLAAITPSKSAAVNIQHAGELYLRYAFDNPEKYRLMFGPTISDRHNYPQLVSAGRAAFTVLQTFIEQGQASGEITKVPAALLANSCWANIHGFALAHMDGLLENLELPASHEEVLTQHIELMVRAIKA